MITTRSRTESMLFQASANMFGWIAVLMLALLNALLLGQSSAYGPEPLIPAVILCAIMLLCHCLWQALNRPPAALRVSPVALWLLPLLGVIIVHGIFSPAPWQAQYEAAIATIALVAFWIGAHHLRQPAQIYALLIAIAAPLALGIAFALLQSLAQLDSKMWVLDLIGKTLYKPDESGLAHGVASGLFASNRSFAALLAIALPVAAVYGLCVRLRRPQRVALLILCWFGLWVLVLAQDRTTLLVTAIALLATPFLARSRDLPAKFALPLILLLLISTLAAGYFCSSSAQVWIRSGLPESPTQTGLIRGGWSIFLDNPVFGAGLGNFANAFEAHRPAGFTHSLIASPPVWIKLLAELGLLGTLAALGLGACVLVRLGRLWWQMPNAIKIEDEDIEMPGRRYCQPLKTVTTGATLIASLSATALLLCGNPMPEAALLVLGLSLLGMGVAQLPLPPRQVAAKQYSGQAVSATGLVLAALLPALALPLLIAQLHVRQAEDAIPRWQQLSPEQLQENQPAIRRQQRRLEKATRLTPENASAWTLLSHAYMLQIHAEEGVAQHMEQLAEQAAQRAIAIHPAYLPGWLALANAEQIAGNTATAEQALQNAINCSPANPYCWYRMADLLKQTPASRAKALDAINRSLELDPNNHLAQQVHRQLLLP